MSEPYEELYEPRQTVKILNSCGTGTEFGVERTHHRRSNQIPSELTNIERFEFQVDRYRLVSLVKCLFVQLRRCQQPSFRHVTVKQGAARRLFSKAGFLTHDYFIEKMENNLHHKSNLLMRHYRKKNFVIIRNDSPCHVLVVGVGN